jgi:thiosulfate dehydrogenase [quinone] large subunit
MSNEQKQECDCGCGCDESNNTCACPLGGDPGKTFAFWVLRAWLGARAVFTGLSKWHAEESNTAVAGSGTGAADYGSAAANKAAALAPADPAAAASTAANAAAGAADKVADTAAAAVHYVHHGLPQGGDWTLAGFLSEENRVWYMPEWALRIFDNTLGYILIALGVTLLLGIGTRVSLFFQGLLYTGLTLGFIAISKEPGSSAGITMLGVHVALVVAALLLAKHNKLAVLNKF